MSNKEEFVIKKPKQRPTHIEPWFFRYLNEGQLKVVHAILAHGNYKDRTKDSYANNRTIAFYCGFGLIKPGTKEYDKFKELSKEKQESYKKYKISNAIQTVKNIKAQLEEMGVITRIVKNGKNYAIVDLDCFKERYLKEFNEYFLDDTEEETNDKEKIKEEIKQIEELLEAGNVSKDSIADRLEKLSQKLKENEVREIPIEDSEILAEHITNSRIDSGKKINDKEAYKTTITKELKNNTFNNPMPFYKALINKEIETLKEAIFDYMFTNFTTKNFDDKQFIIEKISFNHNYNVYTAIYFEKENEENRTQIIIDSELLTEIIIQQPISFSTNYTYVTKQMIENYKDAKHKFLANYGGNKNE